MITLQDIKQNIKFIKYHLCFEVTNPLEKAETERMLTRCGIKYVKGYNDTTNATMYAVIGIDDPVEENVRSFLRWFKKDGKWKYYLAKHPIPFTPNIITYIK